MANGGFVHCRGKSTLIRRELTTGSDYYIGDVVKHVNTGKASLRAAGDTAANLLGVIVSLGLKGPGGTLKPLIFNQPDKGPYVASGETGVALIEVDPYALFEVVSDEVFQETQIGLNADVIAGTADTLLGQSGYAIDGSTAATTNTLPFKIVGYSPTEAINGYVDTTAGGKILVQMNPAVHILTTGTGI